MRDINVKTVKLDCTEVNKITPYIDGNLSFDQKKKYEKHLQGCNICSDSLQKKVQHLQAIEALIPVKHLAMDDQKDLEEEITELFNSFKKKSKIQTTAKKLIDKVVDLF